MLHQKVVLVVVVDQVNKNKVNKSSLISEIYLHFSEKSKPVGNEPITARKSQDISSHMDTEKTATKKSIYLKAAEFLLKYNIATV
jgi:hypothetical protein